VRAILSLALAISIFALPAAAAKPEPVAKPSPSQAKKPSAGALLQRADFKVSGASCVACLRRVAKRMRECDGVLKADVSIFRPYWGLVVYDKKKTTLKKILDAAIEDKVKFVQVTDVAISEMPVVLLPKTR
jgi:copper chaperone CopZ